MVTSGFQATGFELVSNLDLLVVLAFIIKAVLKFNNELNGFTETVHDEFLVLECSDLGEFDSLFLLCKFAEDVLLLALETHLFDATFLLTIRCENLGQESFFTVALWSFCDNADDTFSNVLLEAIVFDEFFGIDLFQIANFQTCISEQLCG